MAPISIFSAGTWNNKTYNMEITSNSTITSFGFNPDNHTLTFEAEGTSGTSGFCRIAIQTSIMWCDNPDEWTIKVGGTVIDRTIIENGNYTYMYFTYSHSAKTV